NVDLDDPSRPAKRQGYSIIPAGATGLSSAVQRLVLLSYFDNGPGSRMLVTGAEQGGLYVISTPDSQTGWSEARVTSSPDGTVNLRFNLNPDSPAAFQGNALLWIIPGGGSNVHALRLNGTLIDCGDVNESPPK